MFAEIGLKMKKQKGFLNNQSITKKIFIIAIIIHIVFWYGYLIFFPLVFDIGLPPNDFYRIFMPTVKNFLQNPATIYEVVDVGTDPIDFPWYFNLPLIPYRGLPSLVFYYYIFFTIPSENLFNFYVCNLWLVFWNIGSCYLINEICKLEKFKRMQGKSIFKDPYLLMSFYLLNLWHTQEYLDGQTNVIAAFFILLGIYFFLREKEHIGIMSWSIAVIFKINPIFLIIFFLFSNSIKKTAKNLLYAIIPHIIDILMLLFWPKLISDYIDQNLYASIVQKQHYFWNSGSVARELSKLLNPNLFMPLVLIVFFIIFPLNFLLFHKFKKRLNFFERLIIAFLTMIIVFPDFHRSHVLYFSGVYVLWISIKKFNFGKKIKIITGIPTIFLSLTLLSLYFSIPIFSFLYLISLLMIDYSLISKRNKTAPVLMYEN